MATLVRPEKPDLGPEGSALWDRVVADRGDDLSGSDYSLLKLWCQWLDKAHDRLLEPNKEIAAGIATDKVLKFCEAFGVGPAERRKQGLGAKKAPEGRKKTALDDLTPEKLGGASGTEKKRGDRIPG